MMRRIAGVALLLLATGLAFYAFYNSQRPAERELVFSTSSMLTNTWTRYKAAFLEPSSGRIIDPDQANITTSEGQSYCMLRAVWQDDKPAFDRCWIFAKDNLKRPDDWLFAWKYGQRADESYGILLDQGGGNSASDADTHIALALIMAYGRWQQSAYLEQAKPIIDDIWRHEVTQIQGKPVLTANNLEQDKQTPIVNPSYFAPYAYRAFAAIDKDHNWTGVTDSAYAIIGRASAAPLDKSKSAGLPPNWLAIDRATGEIQPAAREGLTTDYGYDALRVPWRLALDLQWHRENRARVILDTYNFLSQQWESGQRLAATYSHDGAVLADYESPAVYGGSLGYFVTTDKAKAVYEAKIKALYNEDTKSWAKKQNYYDDNWAWFGAALYLEALPDLTKGIRS